jgi:hypothetical protein
LSDLKREITESVRDLGRRIDHVFHLDRDRRCDEAQRHIRAWSPQPMRGSSPSGQLQPRRSEALHGLLVPSTGRSPAGGQSPARRRPGKCQWKDSRTGRIGTLPASIRPSFGQEATLRVEQGGRCTPRRQAPEARAPSFERAGGIIPERWAASSGFRRPTGLLRPAGLFLGFTAPSVKITGEMHVFPRPRQRAGYSTPCALDAAQTVKFRGGELFFVFNVSSARSRRLWAGTARQRESK